MLKLITLFYFLIFSFNIKAQFYQDLFNHAKQEFSQTLNTNAKRLTEEGLKYLKDKSEKISIVSRQTKEANSTSNYLNDDTRLISSEKTEEFLKQNYPKFYFLYKDVLRDKYVNEVLFVIREKSDWVANANINGSIFFDLNQFDVAKGTRDENDKCWALLIMQGYLHQMIDRPDLQGVEKEYYKFEFAFKNAKSYANAGQCNALRRAVNYWKKRDFSDVNKKVARDQLVKTKEFSDAEKWIITTTCN